MILITRRFGHKHVNVDALSRHLFWGANKKHCPKPESQTFIVQGKYIWFIQWDSGSRTPRVDSKTTKTI